MRAGRAVAAGLTAAYYAVLVITAAAASKAPKCQRQARFLLSADSNVDPGEAVDLRITVLKRSKCISEPSRCTVLLDVPDGAAVSMAFQSLADEAFVKDVSRNIIHTRSRNSSPVART